MTPQEAEIERTGKHVFALALCLAGAVGTALYSLYHWLRFGTWATITLSTLADAPTEKWVGLNRIVAAIWQWPLWVLLLLIAVGIVFYIDRPRS